MLLKDKISLYFEDVKTSIGLTINLTILGLIILSLVIFVTETYALPNSIRNFLDTLDTLILAIFALEYLLRFWIAESKIKFFFSLFSLIDLVALVPLLTGLIDTRFLIIFRWFRLLRLIRFLEIEISIFRIKTEDGVILARIILTLFSIIFIYSGLIYQVEHQINPEAFKTFLDAFYFAIVTMTTVGFGDITPTSEAGRLITSLMILTGIAVIPWQIGDLIKQLVKTADRVEKYCSGCGLSSHDTDARFCKICGFKLNELSREVKH